jgi:mono/diheme cytochrome c family protein
MSRSVLLAASTLALAMLAGCRGDPSDEPPVHLQRNMFHQERYNPQSSSPFFTDGRTMRAPEPGTISREEYDQYGGDDSILTGRQDNRFVMTIPAGAVDRAGGYEKLVTRGQERFNIYCAPCHSRTGDGQGIVARRPGSFAKVTSLHEKAVKDMPDGQLFATITNGVRTMPSYAAQIPVGDRWAIVSYVRALELSQVSQAEPKK